MKLNHPVTNREVEFSEDMTILSTTNTKGQITYINQDFLDISGFDKTELLGQSHNIVRHPDMPPAAFENLWETVRGEESWMGIVKNRCKNGDHYWVNAFVTPIKRDGEIVEYQSVRTKPNQEDIKRAETLYKSIGSEGKQRLNIPKVSMCMKLYSIALFAMLPMFLLSIFSGTPVITSSIVLFVSLLLVLSGIWYVTKNYRQAVSASADVVDNDLLQQVYTGARDDSGKIILAIKMLKAEITAISGRIADSADHLRDTASELSSNVALTNQGVKHQSVETANLTTAIDEMLSSSKQVSENAQLAADAANNASDSAFEGQSIVSSTISSINHLANQVQQSSEVIKRLENDSENIGSILDVIKTIAEQTNLLALNAAIEAARAGEQGRGFAVVADEVRSLASRTQQSTQEIETMIASLQDGARDAVIAMEEGCKKAELGVEQAAKADSALEKITGAVNRIKDMNVLIASAAEEQTAVASQVTDNVSVITEVSELTVETLDSSKKISHHLDELSNTMFELSHHFRTIIS